MGGSLPWEGGQSEDELCCGAGVDGDSVDGEVDVPGLRVILERSRSLQLPSSSWVAAAGGGRS